eukprot:TRINITY_DN2221_c0_g1_i4.p1 TRINITY_DN2221_c0_g1~~TRINITY_DN2221_c0_g1_i4.p1  ORF type:complete len:523 (-),score=107.08 TRINITY_DN2221_c0_g1_i4:17-1585(-)
MHDERRSLTSPGYGSAPRLWVTTNPRTARLLVIGVVIAVLAVLVVVVTLIVVLENRKGPTSHTPLPQAVTLASIMTHLKALEGIALGPGGGSRAVLTGYNKSAEYVMDQLSANTDCDLYTQEFLVPVYTQLSDPVVALQQPYNLSFVVGSDFLQTRYGGNGEYNILAPVFDIGDGCNASDHTNFPPGAIAIAQNGGRCVQYDKALNAEALNAAALLIVMSRGAAPAYGRVRSVGWSPGIPLVRIPVLSISTTMGTLVRNVIASASINLVTNSSVVIANTFNVLCATKSGDPERTVVVGAHLDGVPEGPGINDDGSGSATVLEMAIQVHKTGMPLTNRILFAWWGSEEIGLLGSRYFVAQLNGTRHNDMQVALNLNFDMLASPNYARQVYNGTTVVLPGARYGSEKIHKMFTDHFDSSGLAWELTPMTGGSDYIPFIEAGFPAGGLATGAGGIKSVAQVVKFGGTANTPYDPCYHLYCDLLTNIGQDILDQNARAASTIIQDLAGRGDLEEFLRPPQYETETN